jgi:hypothetical protein
MALRSTIDYTYKAAMTIFFREADIRRKPVAATARGAYI